ncbi:MatE family protein [Trichomonas vaginalis G3]|uniref:MatE family protein n=1 Tax=Trichomonas vaginalis (strain ATCC PRA-98 / G3) TaxID=412133 RepID=A2DZE0_TRIV3|nr:multidrug resistance protein YPNP-related family [Trichomonas vaginalis G3]EAY14269.1 MatE family protein [Trichomonas vaginalis G3]KAI5491870.1 multidrug resistance protein YPNP-related family [Trichomonas vaginalis G3]|eukprot:XP_001326492.1 MatE family protein [Trichomonas vaginalis G3]
MGPMVSQVIGALYSIVDTIWVAKACGDRGMAAVSTYNCFDNIGRSFGFFMCTAASTKTAQLFGQRKESDTKQVFSDLIRCSIICSLIVPVILIPTVKHAARWFGADESLVEFGFEYISLLSYGSISTCLFLCCGGFLQGEGRTHVFAIMELISFVLNGLIFDPVLLLVGKLGVRGAALATVLSELFPALILIGLYYKGIFAVKPQLGDLFKKFSPHTFPALKVGFSQLITNLSYFVPTIIVRKLLGLSLPKD